MFTVGLDTSALDPNFKEHALRGIGRYVRELNRCFSALSDSEVKVSAFDHKTLAALPLLEKVLDRFPVGKATLKHQVMYPLRMGLSGRLGFDLLHFPAHMDAPSWCPKRYVITVLDLIPVVMEQLYRPDRPGWRFALARWLEKRSIKNASLVLAISENTARDTTRILGVPPEKIVVTPLGVDEKFFGSRWGLDDLRLRARWGIPAGRPVVLYVGGIDQRKNWSGLLRVFKRVAERRRADRLSAPVLFMSGRIESDRQFPRLTQLIKELSLDDSVIMPGYVPDEDLIPIYGISAAFCFLSLYEGFGLTPLEAMAAGLPVISSNTACMPEVLGDAALMVNPADHGAAAEAVCRVLEDKDLGLSLSEKGRRRAQGYTWQRTGDLTLQAYKRFLEKRA